jgi:hypothetical protein
LFHIAPTYQLGAGLFDILSTSDTRLFGWMDEQSLPDFSSSPPNSPWSLYHPLKDRSALNHNHDFTINHNIRIYRSNNHSHDSNTDHNYGQRR